MIQCLKHKAKERPEKRRGNKVSELRPPHLEQPGQKNTMVSEKLILLLFIYFCLVSICRQCEPFPDHFQYFLFHSWKILFEFNNYIVISHNFVLYIGISTV